MKVFLDTNILIFASINRSLYVENILDYISTNCELLISDYVIYEYNKTIKKEKLAKYNCVNVLNKFPFKIIKSNTKEKIEMEIRDKKDYQVLCDAILANADILITNDKDFDGVMIKKPRILNLIQFSKEFMQ